MPHPSQHSSSYGFVGTGEITTAIVEGLQARTDESPTVFLSPRNHTVAHELASRFQRVHVCESNQDVLDRTTSIVLAVPPQAAHSVLAGLSFRPEHVVISAVAGLRLQRLREQAASAGELVRAIPLPQAAQRRSLTAIHPDSAIARELFDQVGGVVVPDEEPTLDAFSAATATFAAHLDYLATVAAWLAENGADPTTATAFITHVFGQLGRSLSEQDDALTTMTSKHSTPGGINEQLMTYLREDGVPDTVRNGLDRVLSRLRDQTD